MSTEQELFEQVLVCQHGSRHRYAIPRMLEEEGLLAGLYTDSTVYSIGGKLASALKKIGVNWPRMNALVARRPEGVARHKVFSSDRLFVASMLRGLVPEDLSAAFMRWGGQGAGIVYNMYGEDYRFLKWIKKKGCKLIVDVFVHPATSRIVADEHRRFVSEYEHDERLIRILNEHSKQTFQLADILLCPSGWVADGVREMFPENAHKVRVVPYGSSLAIRKETANAPVPGRILFAGREPLRKGLHYLAEAASLARQSGVQLDVRAAGVDPRQIGWMEYRNEIHCLGTLPMNMMRAEFELADVCVLPSLSEGQASVLLEAMACGCPVIATRESGVDFMPGCGITVPSRDPQALAAAIAEVVGNRSGRAQLADGARRQASEYSMEVWKQRLIAVVKETASLSEGGTL